MRRDSLVSRMSKKILRSKRNVFLRADFTSLSSDYDQVGRALRRLVTEKHLVNIGYGLYAKARINSITGEVMLAAKGGFDEVVKEALTRIGADYEDLSDQLMNYPDSTQVASNTVLKIKSRTSRKIAFGEKYKLNVA